MATTELDTPAATLALAAELRMLVGGLKRKLRQHGQFGDLTLSQAAVLHHLDRDGPATVTALARAEGVRPQSMGATIAGLEEAGLVKGRLDPADGRQTILSLTDDARGRIKASRAARDDWLFNVIRTTFTRREQQTLANAMQLLKRIVDH